jgi:molybdopterin/thiamine biosynthesis adenylyltransferase
MALDGWNEEHRMRLPRVKREHDPFRLPDGTIRLGRQCFGIAAEIQDPTGSVWNLIATMDGTRTVEQIDTRMAELHPDVSADEVHAAIGALIAAGYVEDCGAPVPGGLTRRDIERYDRSMSYFSFVDLVPRSSPWEPQLLMRRARVTVVGLGGVGSNAAVALAASGIGFLHCVDRDTVELSNLNRQVIYAEHDVGRAKAEVCVERLRELNSDIQITGKQAEIGGVGDLRALASECDVLVLGADAPPAIQAWTNLACLETATAWVDVAYVGPVVTCVTFVPGQGPCWQCMATAMRNPDRHDFAPYIGNPVMASSAGIGGGLAANAVTEVVTGSPHLVPGRIYAVNVVRPDATFSLDAPVDADCPACAHGLLAGDLASR